MNKAATDAPPKVPAVGSQVDLVLGPLRELAEEGAEMHSPGMPERTICDGLLAALDEVERLRAAFRLLLNASDSDMEDGDLARRIAREMLGPNS